MTDNLHPSHKTRVSDASSFDEICTVCGATDRTAGGWGCLAEPCPMTDTPTSDTPAVPEPVAFAHVENGKLYCLSPHKSYLSPTALYSAAQMQALADRLAEAEKERDEWKALSERQLGKVLESAKATTSAEAALAEARKVIDGLEQACEHLAATRSHALYKTMIDAGQSDALLALDAKRRDARQWLSANPAKETKG